MKKRIVAWLCSIAMVLSALWIAPAQTAEAADGTISITATEARFVKDGGHANFSMSGMPTDYVRGNGNFVTQEFIDAGWITFDGGMTAEDYLNGHLTSYLATAEIIQFNWRDRGSAFSNGASFTLKAGAPLTYVREDESIGTVTLDANYTFTFYESDNADNYYNILRVSKFLEKGTISITSTGTDLTIDTTYNYNYMNIVFTAISDFGSSISEGYVNADYVDAGYITLDGMTKDDLFGNMRKGRIEVNNTIQFSYDMRENGFPIGSSFTWHKGAPLYYTDNAGVKSIVRLDADYQFVVNEPVNSGCHCSLKVNKVLVPECKGEAGITSTSVSFAVEDTYNYININMDSMSDWAGRSDEGYINADYIDAGYITFDGGLTEEDFLANLSAGRLEANGIIQLNYAVRESGFPVGSSFTWHEGAPIYYKNTAGGISYVTLNATYKFTCTEGAANNYHNRFSVEKVIIPEYKGETGIASEGVIFAIDTTYNYNYINIDFGQAVPDWQSRPTDGHINVDYVEEGHLVLGGGLTTDVLFAGLRSGRLETSTIVQLCYDMRETGFPEGSFMIFKKGAPFYYNDTEGGISYVTLDADYKFIFTAFEDGEKHNTATVTLLICSVEGHKPEAVPGKDATCQEPGLTEGSACTVCGEVLVEQEEIEPIAHNIVHKEAIEPACHYNGHIEHWYCSVCGTYWQDEARTQLTNSKRVVLPATGSDNVEHVEAKEPTCNELGNVEYWHCPDCEQFWTDESCTALTNALSIKLPMTEHNIIHVEAIEPDCHYNGRIEHWYCTICRTFWADEACTQLTNALSVILPATKDGELVHVEAKEPTCKEEGNIEHWYCKDCLQFWQNEALTQLTNAMNVKLGIVDHKAEKLPAVEPQVGKTGLTEGSKCSVCGDILVAQKTIAAKKLAAPKASKITKATGGKKQITVKFKKVSGVTRYEIQIATKKNMKKGLKTYKVTKSKDMKNAKYVVKKLKAKTTYYVRIRTVKTVNGVTKTSAWSKAVKASKTK